VVLALVKYQLCELMGTGIDPGMVEVQRRYMVALKVRLTFE